MVKIRKGMRFNGYEIISRAVEEGILVGYKRAFKHTDKPDEGFIQDKIFEAVMSEICEVVTFEHEYDQ